MNKHLKGLGARMASGGPKASLAPKAKLPMTEGLKLPESLDKAKTFPRKTPMERQDKPGSAY